MPQILAAILTCAVLEIALTFRQTKAFVWPASAMLTGSGVALILRVVGTPPDDHWTTYAWEVFADRRRRCRCCSKYVIRYRGTHVFNPSNIGLVVAFIVLGTSRVEPLDFWWAPLNAAMLARLRRDPRRRAADHPAAAAARRSRRRSGSRSRPASGCSPARGHCMTANWAFAPVCGVDFWRVIVTSPEMMIFLFFMITDPKTVPGGRVGRVVFGVARGGGQHAPAWRPRPTSSARRSGCSRGSSSLCAARPLLDRLRSRAELGRGRSAARSRPRLATGGKPAAGIARAPRASAWPPSLLLVLGAGIVVAGYAGARLRRARTRAEILNRPPMHDRSGDAAGRSPSARTSSTSTTSSPGHGHAGRCS